MKRDKKKKKLTKKRKKKIKKCFLKNDITPETERLCKKETDYKTEGLKKGVL